MILGLIPARGGSKGIPRKNIRVLAGRPLIAWTIESAKSSKLLDRFLVSTEDDEIAHAAGQYGAEVIKRPQELAGDEVSALEVMKHAVGELNPDALVYLQPTSPIRDKGLIDFCIQRFLNTDADSLATGFISKHVEYAESLDRPRQKIKGFFYDDGNVYVIKASLIKKGERYGRKIEQVLTDREQNIEIDDEFDFWLAQEVLKKRLGQSKEGGIFYEVRSNGG
jgi:N-acylneuraminate cytidylyltransferase